MLNVTTILQRAFNNDAAVFSVLMKRCLLIACKGIWTCFCAVQKRNVGFVIVCVAIVLLLAAGSNLHIHYVLLLLDSGLPDATVVVIIDLRSYLFTSRY